MGRTSNKSETHMTNETESKSVTTTKWDGDILTIEVRGAGTIMFDRTKCSTSVRDQAEREGFVKRLINRAAISRDTETGKSASPETKFNAVKSLADFYETGTEDWSMKGPGRVIDTEALLAKLSPENLIAKMSPEQLAAIQALMAQSQANNAG